MCFSEGASFTAAAVLTGVSVLTFRSAKGAPERLCIAAIPLLFAIQQAMEGIQWLFFKGTITSVPAMEAARDLYLLIAYVIWPFWVPLALWLAEGEEGRKRGLALLTVLGLIVSVWNGYSVLFQPVHSSIFENSIRYDVATIKVQDILYAIAVLFPWFVSSIPRAKWMGVFGLVALLFSYYVFYVTMTSVWCFFAAIISVSILWMLRSLPIKSRSRK